MMYVARILYPVQVLGPGKRIGIWVAGCKHKCKGCSNPELWEQDEKYLVTSQQVEQLIRKIAERNVVDGFTITGGDPMEQAEDIAELLETVKDISDDIILYTGYEVGELVSDKQKKLLDKITVLIDGRYREELNDNSFMRGSSNQQIHILKHKYEHKYRDYIDNGCNEIQNFMINNEVVSVGIHKKNFKL
jgi:anaerobic ribonucleoside-triphosphate reductase activating protein